MAYKIPSFQDLPLKFNQHVVVDVRTGATFLSSLDSSKSAIADVVRQCGEQAFNELAVEDRREVGALAFGSLSALLSGAPPVPFHVDHAGPYATIGGSLGEKNADLLLRRHREILSGSVITDEDHEVLRFVDEMNEKARAAHEKREAGRTAGPSAGGLEGLLGELGIGGGVKLVGLEGLLDLLGGNDEPKH